MPEYFKLTNKKLVQAIKIVNALNPKVLSQILTNMIFKLLRSTVAEIYTPKESEELAEKLKLSLNQFGLFVHFSIYVFEMALYHSLNADRLKAALSDAQLEDAVGAVFAEVWQSEGREYVTQMKERSLGGRVLKDVQYRTQIKLMDDGLYNQVETNTLFEFKFNEKKDDFVVEFSKSELYDFFQKLEQIQAQLDQLS